MVKTVAGELCQVEDCRKRDWYHKGIRKILWSFGLERFCCVYIHSDHNNKHYRVMDTIVDIVVDNYSRLQPLFKNSIIYKIKKKSRKTNV